MVGNPDLIAYDLRSDFGYLGDVGCLPSSLQDLITTPASVPVYTANLAAQVAAQIGSGWNGPYVKGSATGQETAEFTNDQWGNPYTYTPAAGTCPLTATFKSAGPDGVAGNTDDIDFSITATDTTSTVSGFIKDPNGNPLQSSTVTFNYPVNGTLTTTSGTTNSSGAYSISGIPLGKRSINVTPKLVVTSASATTQTLDDQTICGSAHGGTSPCHWLEFTLANFSTSPVTVSTLRADYTGGSSYYRIMWGATAVMDCDTTCTVGTPTTIPVTGSVRTFPSSQTVPAASSALKPYVVTIDSSPDQLSDIKIGAAGEVGSAVRVRLINFRNCNSRSDCGSVISVSGVTFTITFSDGSVVQFTPAGFVPP